MKFILILLVHVFLIVFSTGEQCLVLDGLWYGDYGSQLVLKQVNDGTLLGYYTTAEGELDINNESNGPLNITGVAAYNQSGAVFSLSAMWMAGSFMKVWTGQCLVYGNDEVLQTSWLLSERAKHCNDKSLTTSIGETIFKRRHEGNEPKNVRRRKRYYQDEGITSPLPSCSLLGVWYNELGSEVNITYYKNTKIRGVYRSAVEANDKSELFRNYGLVYGMGNDLDTSTTIALYVDWNNGTSVTGWAGQCHLCGPEQKETIVTTWLLRTKVNSYQQNWRATNVGFDYFTRHKQ